MDVKLRHKTFEVTLNIEDDFDVTKSGSRGWEWINTNGDYYEGYFQWEDGKVIDWDGIDELPFSVPLAFMYIGLSIDDLPDVAEKIS